MTYNIKLNIGNPEFLTCVLGNIEVVVEYNQTFNNTLDSIRQALSVGYSFQEATVDSHNRMCMTFSLPDGDICNDMRNLHFLVEQHHTDIAGRLKNVFLPDMSLVFNVDVLY